MSVGRGASSDGSGWREGGGEHADVCGAQQWGGSNAGGVHGLEDGLNGLRGAWAFKSERRGVQTRAHGRSNQGSWTRQDPPGGLS